MRTAEGPPNYGPSVGQYGKISERGNEIYIMTATIQCQVYSNQSYDKPTYSPTQASTPKFPNTCLPPNPSLEPIPFPRAQHYELLLISYVPLHSHTIVLQPVKPRNRTVSNDELISRTGAIYIYMVLPDAEVTVNKELVRI